MENIRAIQVNIWGQFNALIDEYLARRGGC